MLALCFVADSVGVPSGVVRMYQGSVQYKERLFLYYRIAGKEKEHQGFLTRLCRLPKAG